MTTLHQILDHTPFWVFGLLAYLLWQGVLAMRDQTLTLRRLLLVPLVFSAWGIASLLRGHPDAAAIGCWLAGGVLLVPAGLLTGPVLLTVDGATGLVRRRGSVAPLLRNVLVFLLKYGFAVALARRPENHALLLASAAVSGATTGYFAGWLLALRSRYLAGPRSALQQPV